MTERFQCPEPSARAHVLAATIINDTVDQLGGFVAGGDALRAAYAIDLPAIVRSEVERMLIEVYARRLSPDLYGAGEEYLAARFGEGGARPTIVGYGQVIVRENYVEINGFHVKHGGRDFLEPRALEWARKRLDEAIEGRPIPSAPAASTASREPLRYGAPVPFTESERAFLRDLANRHNDLASAQALLAEKSP